MRSAASFAAVLMAVAAPLIAASNADLDLAAKKSLKADVGELKFVNTSFNDAIESLRDQTNANLNVHWKTLTDAGVDKAAPVNVRVRGVKLRKALELILADAGDKVPLTFYVDQGVIEITTQADADTKMVTRVYSVGDLTVDVPNFKGQEMSLTQATSSSGGGSSGGGGGGGGGGGIFGGSSSSSDSSDKPLTEAQRGDQLVQTITTSIRPEIWKVNGGTASISYFKGQLIVTAPRSIQDQIGGSVN